MDRTTYNNYYCFFEKFSFVEFSISLEVLVAKMLKIFYFKKAHFEFPGKMLKTSSKVVENDRIVRLFWQKVSKILDNFVVASIF